MINQKDKKFLEIKTSLALEAQYYLDSELFSSHCKMIADKYGVKPVSLVDLVIDFVAADFDFQTLDRALVKLSGLDQAKRIGLACDFLGILFYPIERFVDNCEAKREIIKLGGDISHYQVYVERLDDFLEDAQFKLIDEMINFHERLVRPDEEKSAAFDILEDGIGALLVDGSREAIANLNGGFIYLLNFVEGFKEEAVQRLLKNKEVISAKKFTLFEKPQVASVSNWLQYFISEKGSGIFDELTLSTFISDSANSRILSEKEKNIVVKLLKLYRAIAFFPESLAGTPPEQWEIIPTEKTAEPGRETQLAHQKPAGREAVIEQLKGSVDSYAPGSLEREILEEESERDREYHKLLLLKNKYPEGSLERRAVEEEIKKMEK